MDEQVDEDEELLSEERSESAVAAEMEEEKLFTDNRSIQGENELEMPNFYCIGCKQHHFSKCFETSATLPQDLNQFAAVTQKQNQ